jgi:AcrR family transcriptional regulator
LAGGVSAGADVSVDEPTPDGAGTTADGRRLTPKAAATRSRIIESATELFATDGYAAVTVRAIAARSGVTSGAIYATFRGKADLLIEAVRASIATDLNDVPVDVLTRPLPQIDANQFASADTPRRQRLRMLMIEAAVAARTDPAVRDHLHGLLAERLADWTISHEKWQQEAHVDPDLDMRQLTALLMCIEIGSGVMLAAGIDAPTGEHTANLVERMLQGLVPKRSR